MLKDIQKQLLLKYPLLWNTKFVPMLLLGIVLHILFFGLGYIDGTIDFSNENNIDISFPSISFGVLFVIIIFILWLINYFKNNALKSFYSKSKNSLFYEWFQIFIISFLLVSFYIPFSIGKQLHQRSYFSKEETTKRCKTISMADMFIDGSFAETEMDSILKSEVSEEEYNNYYNNGDNYGDNDDYFYFRKNYIMFNGKKFSASSLLNRNVYDFSIISREQDSLNRIEVQNWLFNNKPNEVKNLMNNHLTLLKEHHLLTNLTSKKWFEITYKTPDFVDFSNIVPYLNQYEANDWYYNNYNVQHVIETATSLNSREKYSNYYIQQDILKSKYNTVSYAHTNSFFDWEAILGFLYGAFGLSILLFSFRVTTGKSWLIALVAVGVINIVYGVFTAVTSSGTLYACLILLSIIGVIFYFCYIYIKKTRIEFSRIALNLSLWTFAMAIPIIWFIIQEYYASKHYQYNYSSPEYIWMRDHTIEMFTLNFIIAIIILFFFSRVIRNWKGIAED